MFDPLHCVICSHYTSRLAFRSRPRVETQVGPCSINAMDYWDKKLSKSITYILRRQIKGGVDSKELLRMLHENSENYKNRTHAELLEAAALIMAGENYRFGFERKGAPMMPGVEITLLKETEERHEKKEAEQEAWTNRGWKRKRKGK